MNPKLTAVIVDDEEHCRATLSGLLQRHHPEVHLIGMAYDVPTGIDLVKKAMPKLLFLDIEMEGRTGFELLQALGDIKPHVIFTTAHVSYAVQAIRFGGLHYLLKPVDTAELEEAVNRARDLIVKDERPDYELLLKNIDRSTGDRMIALPVNNGLEMVNVNEIVQCEAESNYTTVHLREKKRLVISRTLQQFEDMLGTKDFARVHQSHLVSLKHIRKYVKGEGGEVIMSNGQNVPVSRRMKQALMDGLDRLYPPSPGSKGHSPVYTGLLFSKNAFTPSPKSALAPASACNSLSTLS